MWKFLAATALPILISLLAVRARGADDYTAFVYAGCSQARYDAGTQYAADVDAVLSTLTDTAASTPYANYTPPSGAATGLVGLYQCRSDLPAAVCGVCVKASASKLSSLCNSAAGGAVQLRACFVRYGNDSFLGKPDNTVLFKKCGGESGDAGVAALRDAALGALQAASSPAADGSYRAGAAGYVQAMSQCVGDLGAKACTDCVSVAASQLKAGCGDASAGEVYLGKCYARFWSNAGTGTGGGGATPGGGNVIGGGNAGPIGDGGNAGAGSGYGYGFVPRPYGDVQGNHTTPCHHWRLLALLRSFLPLARRRIFSC
uniref:Gnk2-homologous domain-containing protein n=1 Tax=Aegilops tauschii subsp. strangulata TaxID=200361 RepID=A0A453RA14_AEGTS